MDTIAIIGAGPSGLGCAYELTKEKRKKASKLIVFDKNRRVGGLARSLSFKNHTFDLGPHRFYTKNKEILKLWKSVLGEELLIVKRTTRILYDGNLFHYPIRLMEVIRKTSFLDKLLIAVSYSFSKLRFAFKKPKTFEEWCIKNFGSKLYLMFFKSYTEKVWGISCRKIDAKWARQRVKGLSVYSIFKDIFFKNMQDSNRSLIDRFYYPTKGAGYFYEKLVSKYNLKRNLNLDAKVVKVFHRNGKVWGLMTEQNGKSKTTKADQVFSSMPLTQLVYALRPKAPKKVIAAADRLRYRDHITVNFVVRNSNPFPDNWIYIHSPDLKMARVTNYANFGKEAVKGRTVPISVEYFAFKNDHFWRKSDEEIIAKAKKELALSGLIKKEDILGGFVVREVESYPAYYLGHERYFDIIKKYVSGLKNLALIGRGGMFKYDNMDHALYGGILAGRNYLTNNPKYDAWGVNDEDYLEEG